MKTLKILIHINFLQFSHNVLLYIYIYRIITSTKSI